LNFIKACTKLLSCWGYRNWRSTLVLCFFNQRGSLSGYIIKEFLTTSLYGFNLLNKLVDVNSILLDPRTMWVHDLLADVSFARWSLSSAILSWTILVIASRHLLHLHVGGYRLLAVYLADETLHALGHWLTNLGRHVGYDVDDLFLALLSLVICFDYVQDVVILRFIYTLNSFQIKAFSLHVTRGKLIRKIRALKKDIISLKRINWEFGVVYELMLVHLCANSVTEFSPLLLILVILRLKSLIALLKKVALFFYNIKFLSKFLAFNFFLLDI
jgi:hypothetical protein